MTEKKLLWSSIEINNISLMDKITRLWAAAALILALSNGEVHASNNVSDINSNKTNYINKNYNKSFSADNITLLKWIMPSLDSKSLKELNKNIKELLLSANYGEINWEQFLFSFLELSKKYNITNVQLLSVLSDYLKKDIIWDNIKKSLQEKLDLTLKWLLDIYPKDVLDNKFKKTEKLYKEKKLTKEDIEKIFKEYFENQNEIQIILIGLLISLILLLLSMWRKELINSYKQENTDDTSSYR